MRTIDAEGLDADLMIASAATTEYGERCYKDLPSGIRRSLLKVIESTYDHARRIVAKQTTVDAEPKWIPCSERLPAKTGHYLCSFKEPHRIDNIFVGLAYWTGSRWYGYSPLANEIKAWMPLPKPYRERGKNNEKGKTKNPFL